jgi:hypothetical protein
LITALVGVIPVAAVADERFFQYFLVAFIDILG